MTVALLPPLTRGSGFGYREATPLTEGPAYIALNINIVDTGDAVRMASEIARLEAERDDDLYVMAAYPPPESRSIEEWLAVLANHFGPRAQALMDDADRFAAAHSRVNQVPPITIKPGAGCDHGPGWQCVECVPEGGFSFQPLGAEENAR